MSGVIIIHLLMRINFKNILGNDDHSIASDRGIIIYVENMLRNSVINLNKAVPELWLCHLRVCSQFTDSLSLSKTTEKCLQLWQEDIRQM